MTSRLLPQASSTDMMTSWLLNLDFFRSAMLTSSLLLVATSSRHADVIIAESRFLFASNSSDLALLIPDIYCSSSFFDISSSRLHRFCSRSHFRMRPVLFPPKRSNEQDSLLCSELLRFWPNSFV
ncbi:hypothetical protein F511_31099 [Dorcoceras hygrometricum]|uniref:Uncharacterized protein n=1 Tax=Dorcoceras hygrometricum TaxID=472368 RepID=A0A2Z7BE63_9LAMI|nr:hypothetical protein F511_31099 [Dorcoceras hygrometricum]